MAWIELHDTLSGHRKTYALADKLKIKQYAAVGILSCLWTWAINNAENGDLSPFPPVAIARACYWDKRPETLISALKSTGWIDEPMSIHGWDEYAGRLMDKRAQNADRKRRERARHSAVTRDIRETSRGCPAHTVQYSTVPNKTVQNSSIKPFMTDEEQAAVAADQNEVLNEAERAGFPATNRDRDNLIDLMAQYGKDPLLTAIGRCSEYDLSKRNIRYLRGILEKDPTGGTRPKDNDDGPRLPPMIGI